jgi:hypothetical protein
VSLPNSFTPHRPSTRCATSDPAGGTALVWALLFVIITTGMILSHSTFLASNRRELSARYEQQTLAGSFARSGLRDALGWFRRQPLQPVPAFTPALDPGGDPPLFDTLDPTIGLVREFEIKGGLWGRYEVRRDEVRDVSSERGAPGSGAVWDLGARGFVFQRNDASKPFDQAPNRIIATTALGSEMRGVPVALPAAAAVLVDGPGKLQLRRAATIDGAGRPGIAYSDLAAALPVPLDVSATLVGTPAEVAIAGYDMSPKRVFGMPLDQLRGLADLVVRASRVPRLAPTSPTADQPVQFVFAEGGLVLATGRPLRGRVVLVVDGNLTVAAGNGSDVHGMVYVTGDVDVQGPFQLHGTLASLGNVRLGNVAAGGSVLVQYDPRVMSQVQSALQRYRLANTLRSQ